MIIPAQHFLVAAQENFSGQTPSSAARSLFSLDFKHS